MDPSPSLSAAPAASSVLLSRSLGAATPAVPDIASPADTTPFAYPTAPRRRSLAGLGLPNDTTTGTLQGLRKRSAPSRLSDSLPQRVGRCVNTSGGASAPAGPSAESAEGAACSESMQLSEGAAGVISQLLGAASAGATTAREGTKLGLEPGGELLSCYPSARILFADARASMRGDAAGALGDCIICGDDELAPIERGYPGAPGCAHASFHATCLERWSRVTNACPVCKAEFGRIVQLELAPLSFASGAGGCVNRSVFETALDTLEAAGRAPAASLERDKDAIERASLTARSGGLCAIVRAEITVSARTQTYETSEEDLAALGYTREDLEAECEVCESDGDEATLLLCDGADCTAAAHAKCVGLHAVPTSDWYCDRCVSRRVPPRDWVLELPPRDTSRRSSLLAISGGATTCPTEMQDESIRRPQPTRRSIEPSLSRSTRRQMMTRMRSIMLGVLRTTNGADSRGVSFPSRARAIARLDDAIAPHRNSSRRRAPRFPGVGHVLGRFGSPNLSSTPTAFPPASPFFRMSDAAAAFGQWGDEENDDSEEGDDLVIVDGAPGGGTGGTAGASVTGGLLGLTTGAASAPPPARVTRATPSVFGSSELQVSRRQGANSLLLHLPSAARKRRLSAGLGTGMGDTSTSEVQVALLASHLRGSPLPPSLRARLIASAGSPTLHESRTPQTTGALLAGERGASATGGSMSSGGEQGHRDHSPSVTLAAPAPQSAPLPPPPPPRVASRPEIALPSEFALLPLISPPAHDASMRNAKRVLSADECAALEAAVKRACGALLNTGVLQRARFKEAAVRLHAQCKADWPVPLGVIDERAAAVASSMS